MKTPTQKLMEKVQGIIERNQRAMLSANAKGRQDVVEMCGDYHVRLRKIANYLDERDAR